MLGVGGIGGADEEGAFGYKFRRSRINKGAVALVAATLRHVKSFRVGMKGAVNRRRVRFGWASDEKTQPNRTNMGTYCFHKGDVVNKSLASGPGFGKIGA